jgi:hypothetical protein
MAKTITFEGTTHQFPDDASEAEIRSALESAHPATAPLSDRTPAPPQTLTRAGTSFLSGANPLPGLAQMIAHPINTLKNEGARMHRAWDAASLPENAEHPIASRAAALPFIGGLGEQVGDKLSKAFYGEAPKLDKFGSVTESGSEPDPTGELSDLGGMAAGAALGPKIARFAGKTLKTSAQLPTKVAMGSPWKTEAYGATPAKAVLENTEGVRPSTIAKSGQDAINRFKPEMERSVRASTKRIDLTPPRGMVSDAENVATLEGNKPAFQQLAPRREALEGNQVTGNPYPSTVSAEEGLHLKRGWGKQFAKFDPNVHTEVNKLGKDVYHNLADQVHDASPGANELDQKIQSLIPAVRAFSRKDLQAGVGEKLMDRVSRHTGAIGPALLGYHVGGIPAAVGTLVGSDMFSSPTALMVGARSLYGSGRAVGSPVGQALTSGGPLFRQRRQEQE